MNEGMAYMIEYCHDESRLKSFIGIVPSYDPPMDLIGVHLLGRLFEDFHILVADQFLVINGSDEDEALAAGAATKAHLDFLDCVYGESPKMFCSSFTDSDEYADVLGNIRCQADERIAGMMLETVPEKHKNRGIEYPLNELACVKYLAGKGFGLKIGPKKEKAYDRIMKELGFDMDFVYLKPCYALGTKEPEEVVHYSPHSRGSGQRILLSDIQSDRRMKSKLEMGPDEASRYLCRLGSLAGMMLHRGRMQNEEIDSMYGRKLRKTASRLIFENIVEPIRERTNYSWVNRGAL